MTRARVAEIRRLIRWGQRSKDEKVLALAAAARELGLALLDERCRSSTACGLCVWAAGGHYATKRDRYRSLRWAFFCDECRPRARKKGWKFR